MNLTSLTPCNFLPGVCFFRAPHIMMDFDANFMFVGGGTIDSANTILTKMESLNYQDFITGYLMRNPPMHQLDNLQALPFTALTQPV